MRYFVPALLIFALTAPADAAFDGPGSPATVKEAAKVASAAKDSGAVLEGSLTRKVKDELYIFQDASGEVLVEIDDDLMTGRNITPKDKVRLGGHVDREDGSPAVEVDILEVLN
ncbi:MAG: NirD/YgiW/YdeI family stress tolerance protein [Mailhella sp.]|nr:NirD/YgiW/YdeI family stress tolerance protein [Mailhella sp.]